MKTSYKKYGIGGIAQSFGSPMIESGMQTVTGNWGGSPVSVFAKGGYTKRISDNDLYRFREKTKHERIDTEGVGNFELPKDKDTRYLYELNDFDKNLVKHIKLKPNEHIFRYETYSTKIGGYIPLVKINLDNQMVYFLTENAWDGGDIEFVKKGEKAQFINISDKYAKGGAVDKALDKTEKYWYERIKNSNSNSVSSYNLSTNDIVILNRLSSMGLVVKQVIKGTQEATYTIKKYAQGGEFGGGGRSESNEDKFYAFDVVFAHAPRNQPQLTERMFVTVKAKTEKEAIKYAKEEVRAEFRSSKPPHIFSKISPILKSVQTLKERIADEKRRWDEQQERIKNESSSSYSTSQEQERYKFPDLSGLKNPNTTESFAESGEGEDKNQYDFSIRFFKDNLDVLNDDYEYEEFRGTKNNVIKKVNDSLTKGKMVYAYVRIENIVTDWYYESGDLERMRMEVNRYGENEYAKGGQIPSVGDSGVITDKNSMFVGKMALITGDLGNMFEVRVGERTTIVKKNGIRLISDEYAQGGEMADGGYIGKWTTNKNVDSSNKLTFADIKKITPDKFYKYEYFSKTDKVWKDLQKTDSPYSLAQKGYEIQLKVPYRYSMGDGGKMAQGGEFGGGGSTNQSLQGTITNDALPDILKQLPYNFTFELNNERVFSTFGGKNALKEAKMLLKTRYDVDSEIKDVGFKTNSFALIVPSQYVDEKYAQGGMFEVGDWVAEKKGTARGQVYKKLGSFIYLKDKYGNESQTLYSEDKFKKSATPRYDDGGQAKISIANTDIKFDKSLYKGILDDYDLDGLPNADDPNPYSKKDKVSLEQTKLSTAVNNVINVKNKMDDELDVFVKKLQQVAPSDSKIYGRTKTPFSILNKLVNSRLLDQKRGLKDLVGTTVAFENYQDLQNFKKRVDKGMFGKVVDFDDYYENPNDGYRAYHYIVEQDGTPIELQLKTDRMKEINVLSHDAYKNQILNKDYLLYLTTIANDADKGNTHSMEQFSEIMSNKVAVKKKLSSGK